MSSKLPLEETRAMTIDTISMFTSRGIDYMESDVVGIIRVAGSTGQAWGICECCWKVGPMGMACGQTDECSNGRQQFRPVAFANSVFTKSTSGYYNQSGSDNSAFMYEVSTWFIAMWKCMEDFDKIEVSSLMAKTLFIPEGDERLLQYNRNAPPAIIDLRHHVKLLRDSNEANDAQALRTDILEYIIDPRSTHESQFDQDMQKTLMAWARRSVLAEKDTINKVLRENYLLNERVEILLGRLSEGEEDVRRKRPRVTQTGSDDHKGHTDQEGQEPPAGDSCTIL